MNVNERACSMRADGKSFVEIANDLGVSVQWAYKCASHIPLNPPAETAKTVVRYGANNGGCSTTSGMMPVSLPRIPTLDGVTA